MRMSQRAVAGLGIATALSLAMLTGCTAAADGQAPGKSAGAAAPSPTGAPVEAAATGAASSEKVPTRKKAPVDGVTWPGGEAVVASEVLLDKEQVGRSPVSQTVRFDTASAAPKDSTLIPWALTQSAMVGELMPQGNHNKLTETTQRQFELVTVGKTSTTPLAKTWGTLPEDGPRQLLGLDASDDYVVWTEAAGESIVETTWRLFSKDLRTGKVRLLARAEQFGGSKDKPFPGVTGASAPVIVGDSVVWSSPIAEKGNAAAAPTVGLLTVKLSGGKPTRIGSDVGNSFAGINAALSETTQPHQGDPAGMPARITGVVSTGLDGTARKVLGLAPRLDASVVAAKGATLVLSVKGALVIVDTKSKQAWRVAAPSKTKIGKRPAVCGQLVTWSLEDRAAKRPQFFLDLRSERLSGFTFPAKTKGFGDALCNQDVFASTVNDPANPDSRSRVEGFAWEAGHNGSPRS